MEILSKNSAMNVLKSNRGLAEWHFQEIRDSRLKNMQLTEICQNVLQMYIKLIYVCDRKYVYLLNDVRDSALNIYVPHNIVYFLDINGPSDSSTRWINHEKPVVSKYHRQVSQRDVRYPNATSTSIRAETREEEPFPVLPICDWSTRMDFGNRN